MKLLTLVCASALLAACSAPSDPAKDKSAPTSNTTAATTATLNAPAGDYKIDPAHSTLMFKVNHLGISTYVARFKEFDATLKLDPANATASSVTVTVKPASVETDYTGDYKAGHPESRFATWNEDLARSPEFFNSDKYPQASFRSTSVEKTGPDTARITGELTLLGQTHPLTLDAKLVGSVAKSPFTNAGMVGVTATGTFKRSQFGMKHLLQPPLVGDDVTLELNGEFAQVVPAASPTASAN